MGPIVLKWALLQRLADRVRIEERDLGVGSCQISSGVNLKARSSFGRFVGTAGMEWGLWNIWTECAAKGCDAILTVSRAAGALALPQ